MTRSNQVVEILRQKASADPVTSAVLHMWALRQRARNQVTLNGLYAKMKAEGFVHDKKQYEPLLKLMHQLGLGKLQTDNKGRVVALKGVDTSLQSIGRAVCDPKSPGVLRRYRQKHRFQDLALARAEPTPEPVTKVTPATRSTPLPTKAASITVEHAAKSMTFPIPENATEEELAFMIGKFLKFSASL